MCVCTVRRREKYRTMEAAFFCLVLYNLGSLRAMYCTMKIAATSLILPACHVASGVDIFYLKKSQRFNMSNAPFIVI